MTQKANQPLLSHNSIGTQLHPESSPRETMESLHHQQNHQEGQLASDSVATCSTPQTKSMTSPTLQNNYLTKEHADTPQQHALGGPHETDAEPAANNHHIIPSLIQDRTVTETRVSLQFHILPHKIINTNSTKLRSRGRISKISGRVHARCLFIDVDKPNEEDSESSSTSEYSIYLFGGLRKKYMSRFRRLTVSYTSPKSSPEGESSNDLTSPRRTSSPDISLGEGDDDDSATEDDHTTPQSVQTPLSEKEFSHLDGDRSNITPASPTLQINFDISDQQEYSQLRHIAGHVMWCSIVNGEKTLFIHGGAQDPDESILEHSHSNHIFTYNLKRRTFCEPQFNGTWEVPSGKEGHSVHTDSKLSQAWLFGGFDGKRYSNGIHIFDASTLTFSYCHPRPIDANSPHYIPSPRYYHASFLFNNYIYIFGGLEKSGLCSTKFIYLFDTVKCRWLPPLPVPEDVLPEGICEHAMCVFKKHFVLLHGGRFNGKKFQEKIYIINLLTNEWILSKQNPPDSIRDRCGHCILNINDQLWIIGGNSSLTNHNDLSIINCDVSQHERKRTARDNTPITPLSSPAESDIFSTTIERHITSPAFEDLCNQIIETGPTLRPEDNLAGKMYVISPCDHEDYFLRFASVQGPVQFSKILSKYSRLVITYNSSGDIILKNQRSTERKSTYFMLNSSGAKSTRLKKGKVATALKLLPAEQVDEDGRIKKDYRVDPSQIKKFTKYHIKTLEYDCYLSYTEKVSQKKLVVFPRISFEPEKRTLFYTLPLKHRKIFVKSLGVNMYLRDGGNNIRFSKIPNHHTRLIWLLLELPSGAKQNYLRTFSGKFFCLDQGVLTLTQRSSPICIDHVQTKGRDSQVVTISQSSKGCLGVQIDEHTQQPSLMILPDKDTSAQEDAFFEITELQ